MNQIKIGWGRREISLNEKVSLPGQSYMRVSTGILDPLYATAWCIDDGEQAAIFCTVDLVHVRGGMLPIILEKVAAMRPELPADAVIVGATHTHAGPETQPTDDVTPDGEMLYPSRQYREFCCRQCAEAICEAWDNRAEGGIAYGYGFAVVGHSRRVVYFSDVSLRNPNPVSPNGHGVMYGNTRDPEFSHYEGGGDPFLNAVFTFDKDRKLTGIVVNVPCPSQLSETFLQQTSDYWHDVRAVVAKEFGPDVYVLPQCAAAGDLAPRTLHYKQAQARRMALKYDLPYEPAKAKANTQDNYNKVMGERYDIAQRILESLRDIYSWAQKDIQTQLKVAHQRLEVPMERRRITDEEKAWCEANIAHMKNNLPDPEKSTPEEYRVTYSRYESVRRRNENILKTYEIQDQDPVLPSVCHAVRLGDIGFATCRYELYMDFMHRLQARSPFIQTFVVQLAGDEDDMYLATKRAQANKGYSASLFDNPASADAGQHWVEAMLESLQALQQA